MVKEKKFFKIIPPANYSQMTGNTQPPTRVLSEEEAGGNMRKELIKKGWQVEECGKDGGQLSVGSCQKNPDVGNATSGTVTTEIFKNGSAASGTVTLSKPNPQEITKEDRVAELEALSYREVQEIAKSHGVEKVQIKEALLIEAILAEEFK